MKHFAIAALAAVPTFAQWQWIDWPIKQDGTDVMKHFQALSTSQGQVNGNELTVKNNSAMFLKNSMDDGMAAVYRPGVRGGSVSYDVDVSQTDCGCVAGVYLVNIGEGCQQDPMNTTNPQCQSVDVMQANMYGFNVQAHPCANGTCDAKSQCDLNMKIDGVEKYGADAYGPDGTLINTRQAFSVKTEFVSDAAYVKLWKLRTTLMQGSNEIMMEADCGDEYFNALTNAIEGDMGLVFSSWDNSAGLEDFDIDGTCSVVGSCDSARTIINNFNVNRYGSNEDRETDPEPPTPEPPTPEPPTPEPADFETFQAYSSYYDYQNTGDYFNMYVKGLDGRALKTYEKTIEMGDNNRAFVMDGKNDTTTYWSYWHDYVGGTVEFEVDVSDVGCECAASAFLVQLNDENCSWNSYDRDTVPQCSRIELMESNIWGFNVASYPCEFGQCEATSASQTSAWDIDSMAYGPGSDNTIDTTKPYSVKTHFYAEVDAEGTKGGLLRIETCLIQGDNMITLKQDHADYMTTLRDKLEWRMAMGVSSYHVGLENDIAGTCETTCESSNMIIHNLRFTQDDCLVETTPEPEPELIKGGIASNVSNCAEGCTSCIETWWSDAPEEILYECVDETLYKYGGKCGSRKDQSLCGSEDYCHISYPHGDPDKANSVDAACRPMPIEFIENDFFFAAKECRSSTWGLCKYGCGEGETCHNSWWADDATKWKSASSMCRCKPN